VTGLLSQAFVIARRDFTAIVGTPTFLLFLLAPFLMFAISAGMGVGAASMATRGADAARIVAIVAGEDAVRLKAADQRRRGLYEAGDLGPPQLVILAPSADPQAQAKAAMADAAADTGAVLFGPLTRPNILHARGRHFNARYLAELAEEALRAERAALAPGDILSRPVIAAAQAAIPTKTARNAAGVGAVFVIFLLTLVLAGQMVGSLAEEKASKVIEILAASVRLEAVFLGKIFGMFGVAIVFIAFWGLLAGVALNFLPAEIGLAALQPAVGLPAFLMLGAAYFTMAFMLLGAIFLGVGAQASTIREIQMLSLPITIFQVAMFGLSSAAAGDPGSTVARIAEWFPFSSPFAMAARAASDPAIWPHLVALGWQLLWVGLTIRIAARLFRIGVLKSGGGLNGLFGRQTVAAPY
jgi:ABC-2 type transport system permease protein